MVSQFFINHPRFAIILSLCGAIALFICGVCALYLLPVSQYPRLTPPSISVMYNYPGANAKEILNTVAMPIEDEMNGVDDMLYMVGSCSDTGTYNLNVSFKVESDRDMDMAKVQNRVAQAEAKLPAEVKQLGGRIRVQAEDMLGVICLRSPKGTMSRLQISDYIYGNILPVLLRIPGVGEATVYGPKLSMRVWMDPDRMAAQGLNTEEVIAAVTKQNVQASVGSVGTSPIPAHGAKVYTLTAKGRLMTPKEFNEIVIRRDANGGLVKLKDIARMEVGEENNMFTGQFNGDNGVAIVLQQKHGANAIATMDMIQKKMDRLAQSFPEDLEWITPYDATHYMRMCVMEIVTTLLFAFCLVVLVCYLFLQDWRAPLIPCLTIPVSLCSTFILMAIFGYTINILTLFGLVLAIGVVVADCIVVVENIQTLMATEGLSAKEAASKSMHQITGAVITTTLVTVACYIPFAFYGGMVGKMGIQFAFTMCVALCLSTFVALTLSPALCSLLLRPPKKRLSVMCLLARRSLIIAIVILLFTVVPFERFIILVLVALCLHFLQDWRATLISALSIAPLLVSLLLLAVLNPLDTLTPYGFIIVVCSLMDNVIVAVKNSRALMVREGLSAKEAAKKSLHQVIGAVIVTTFVTVVCYFFLLRGGDCPFCFRASVILFVVLSLSALVAFLLLPVFCALLLRPPKERHLVIKGYLSVVRFLVRRGAITAVLFAVVAGSCWVLKDRVKKTLLPDEDKGVVFASMEMPEGTARDRSRDAALRAVEMLRQMPEVAGVQSITGWGMIGGRGENLATLIIDLKGWDKRSLPEQHAAMLVGKIQALLDTVPEPKWQVFMPPAISGFGRLGGVSFNLCSDSGADATALAAAAQAFARRIQELPEAGRVTCGFRADTPHLRLSLDRQKAERHHVPVATIYAALQNYLGSRYVNDVNLGTQVNRVTVAAEASARATPEAVEGLYVRSDLGAMVPVGSLGTISRELGPREITRFNKMPSASINAQVAPGVAPLELISAIERAGAPEGYHIEWSEMSLLEKENQGRLALLMGLAALFAYLFLVAHYESWTIPLPVMCNVVFTLAGAYLGLWITDTPISIYAQFGLVMLIGFSVKNAILMVEFSKQQREETGLPVADAALRGADLCFRAVQMTAWSFLCGVLPLVLATGAGAGSQKAIGISTFSGMLASMFVGIFFTPALYAAFQRLREWMKGLFHRQAT